MNEKNGILKLLLISEILIFIVAMMIISIFGILLYIYFPTNEEVAQGIFTGFMAWIGAIIGFYFGQKPVREVLTRLQERDKEVAQKINKADEAIEYSYKLSALIRKTVEIAKESENEGK